MAYIKTIGFPRMHKEENERRDFLPSLFGELVSYDNIEVFVEKGYGSAMGFTEKDYLAYNPKIKFVDHDDIYMKDMVVVLRAPKDEELEMMKPGAVLVSMLHYETQESRDKLLMRKGIICFSMDGLKNDKNIRMLVNYAGTSRAGSRVAFMELKKRMKDFYSPAREPIKITIIGMGAVGINAAKAFEEFSDEEFYYKNWDMPGFIITMLPRNITKSKKYLGEVLSHTDILVDASKREDATQIIVANEMIGAMPEHAVILDLSADPYNDKLQPIQVKGIEGIPTGNIDKYVIEINDGLYDTIPKDVKSKNRRLVVSCNAWPAVEPIECMEIYNEQLAPFLKVLITKDIDKLDINSDSLHERSLVRASLSYFMQNNLNQAL